MTGPLVIFHAQNEVMFCDDGFAAACVAQMGISQGEPEFFPGIYGQEPPIDRVRDRTVYLLDFSYKRPKLLDLVWQGQPKRLVILDHHKTAEADLAGLDDQIELDAQISTGGHRPDLHVTFDMERSGAILAWRYFFGNFAEPPELLKRIEDGDLWRWAYPDSKLVQAALRSYPQDFETWLDLFDRPIEELAADGVAIRRFIDRKVAELLPNARCTSVAGQWVMAVNCPAFLASEVAGTLAEQSPEGWAAAYFDTATHIVYSLRSRGNGPDVSDIAKAMGGGGHRGAAGFQVQLPP